MMPSCDAAALADLVRRRSEGQQVMRTRRDDLIRACTAAGMSRRAIAAIADLTPARVQQIVAMGNGVEVRLRAPTPPPYTPDEWRALIADTLDTVAPLSDYRPETRLTGLGIMALALRAIESPETITAAEVTAALEAVQEGAGWRLATFGADVMAPIRARWADALGRLPVR
jgi:hypothetical protein